MKEITRIHIAKTAYDIELTAKKAIEKYIAALERYADDPELLGDIEIRITELLGERGVPAGGVITADDVAAVRAQLGEPSEFLPEGAGDIVVGTESADEPGRRVYRDIDSAVLGGVLAGLGRFFGIDPLWVRLIFIVLLFASFGVAIIVYLILWLIIPPARTAAEKLRMNGEPVTLESIKRLGAQAEPVASGTVRVLREVLIYGAGVLLALLALGSIVGVAAAVTGVSFGFESEYSPIAEWKLTESWWFMLMMILLGASGVLFAALCTVLASATFRRQWTKRTSTAVIVIVVVGLAAFMSGVGVGVYGNLEEQARITQARKTTRVNLPTQFSSIKLLKVVGDKNTQGFGHIEYIVSEQSRYELDSLPGVKPQFDIAADGLSATVKLVKSTAGGERPWEYMATPVLRIYGPALDTVELENATPVQYTTHQLQAKLTVTVNSSQFDLEGSYDIVTVASQTGSSVTLARASVANLQVDGGGTVEAGVVSALNVRQPDACAAFEQGTDDYVRVQAVSSGKLTYNGTEQAAKTITNSCGRVIVGRELDDYSKEGAY